MQKSRSGRISPFSAAVRRLGGTLAYRDDVDDLASDFGLLCRQSPGVKAATDHFLVPKHRHFRQRALSVVD